MWISPTLAAFLEVVWKIGIVVIAVGVVALLMWALA
jgi:hypothetical protein